MHAHHPLGKSEEWELGPKPYCSCSASHRIIPRIENLWRLREGCEEYEAWWDPCHPLVMGAHHSRCLQLCSPSRRPEKERTRSGLGTGQMV